MGIKRYICPGSFKMLIGSKPFCTDPTWRGFTEPATRRTVTCGPVIGSDGAGIISNPTSVPGVPQGVTGSFTVADNDFSTGWVVLILGDYRLISYVDFQIGGNVGATALLIANAISTFAGFSATALGPVVTVVYGDPLSKVEFRALHRGTKTNFTTFSPDNGFLGGGSPVLGAPALT